MTERSRALPQAAAPLRDALPSLEAGAEALRARSRLLAERFEPTGSELAAEDAEALAKLARWVDSGCEGDS